MVGFLTALARLYGLAPLVTAARFNVWVVRGTPPLLHTEAALIYLVFCTGLVGAAEPVGEAFGPASDARLKKTSDEITLFLKVSCVCHGVS